MEDAEKFEIVSVLITAFEAPFTYSNNCWLHVLCFERLKMDGIELLEKLLSDFSGELAARTIAKQQLLPLLKLPTKLFRSEVLNVLL